MVRTAGTADARARTSGLRSSIRDALTARVDPASLAVFRIGFGSIIAWEVWRAFDGNLIRVDYDLPTFLFRWWLFEWVRPLPGPLIYIAFAVLGVAAAMVAAGLFHRAAAAVTFAGMAYWFLLDKASYLNHRYLATLIALLFVIVPAHAAYSLDVRRRPDLRRASIAAWPVWLMRFQVGVPYFFGGVAKLNFDWMVRAEPLRSALAAHTDVPVIGATLVNSALAHVLAWGSAALDLSVPFLLLNRRTRTPAFALALTFHLINSRLFEIGIFPWLMIVGSTMFFEPDWPRRLAAGVRSRSGRLRQAVGVGSVVGFLLGGFVPETFSLVRAVVGGFGVAVLAFHVAERRPAGDGEPRRAGAVEHGRAGAVERVNVRGPKLTRPLTVFLGVWFAVQSVVPLAHFAIPGNEYWTEEGNRFAWHMLVRVKRADVEFRVTDPATGRTWVADPSNSLTRYQISKLDVPDMILQFAHHLEDVYRKAGIDDVEVRVDAKASLNMRRPQRYIKRDVDLTTIGRPYLPPARWIVPLRPYLER
jgi:vitamin K-dependent gamma-carboxylase-like protein